MKYAMSLKPTNTPHHVETFVMAGPEQSNSHHGRQHISLQNFEFAHQNPYDVHDFRYPAPPKFQARTQKFVSESNLSTAYEWWNANQDTSSLMECF